MRRQIRLHKSDTEMSDDSVAIVAAEGNENAAAAERKSDFFSMFYLPSSQSYDEDVHLATSSYSAPFQGAATAVVGGILSVFDTALAVLNEEFDNPSDSIISESTKDDGEEEFQRRGGSDVKSKNENSSVLGCYKKFARSMSKSESKDKLSSTNEDKACENSEQLAKHEQNVRDLGVEQSGHEENDHFTPQNSLIGTISTLQLYEEGTGDIIKALTSGRHSTPMNAMDIERNADSCPESSISKKEDSEYCIIRNETETNDGWLVVCDD